MGATGSLQVWRCPLWVPAQPGGLKRLLHLASFALSSLPMMLRQIVWRSDVMWVVEPALFCAPTADGAVVALYSGNMGGKQGLELLADVARLCQDSLRGGGTAPAGAGVPVFVGAAPSPRMPPELVFVFCGNGAGRADWVARCAGLPNVRFLDLQPLDRLPDLLATADIHLLPQKAEAADLVMPSKLTGMLASARAVVASAHADTELATVVQTCGLVVPPGDAVAFAQAVRALAGDRALRERLGAAGFVYAQAHLDREAVLQQLEADVLALVSQPAK